MSDHLLCGEALMQLLEAYGVDTVFGMPGVHTFDLYRGLSATKIRHVQCRHEQGAGFMADGYARVSGRPGVCTIISGPGVTNAATALGQAYADSVPFLCISAATQSYSLGKGWGCLHEITDQQAVTRPLTGYSATALRPEDLPELVGQAYGVMTSGRPRPAHISVPIDVLAMTVENVWTPCQAPGRPLPQPEAIQAAAALLAGAERPVIWLGGGALQAGGSALALAERLGAVVVTSNAGKGIVPDSHPLNLGASTVRPATQAVLCQADLVLAVGTEMAETDSFVERLELSGPVIRIDIDPSKMNDLYPAAVAIQADAGPALAALAAALDGPAKDPALAQATVAQARAASDQALSATERKHLKVWQALRPALPAETVVMGDITQLVYSGSFVFPVEQPGCWFYPAGYCTLGCALPMAIGAKCAQPDRPMIVVAGDGGFMFTLQELAAAVEEKLALPIILWNNDGLQEIRDGMTQRNIPHIGVNSHNPDFLMLARSFGCQALRAESAEQLAEATLAALQAPVPTLIEVRQDAAWLS